MKPTDQDLAELYLLQQVYKQTAVRIEELRALCKEEGSFCTENYVCAVLAQSRRGLAGIDRFIEMLGIDTLIKNNLILQHNFVIVKVSPKIL